MSRLHSYIVLFALLLLPMPSSAQEMTDSLSVDRMVESLTVGDSLMVGDTIAVKKKKSFLSRVVDPFAKFFFDVNPDYVTTSQYNFQALEQAKYNYETYRFKSPDGAVIGLSPRKSLKLGPYIGWSIIFVGVTVDLFHMSDESNRKEWDISLYTLPFVLDIYFREGGSVCTIYRLKLGKDIDTSPAIGLRFDEFDSDIRGFDFTYVFNHKKFSLPAAYNQGAPQIRSSGSFLAGIGFTQHSLSIDWQEFDNLVHGAIPTLPEHALDTLRFDQVNYGDLSISGGYAYNWVFARHWLLAASLSVGISYKYASSSTKYLNDLGETIRGLGDFKFKDLSFDINGRVGIVYNTGKWFFGASYIINSYNYSTSRFNTSSNFGTINAYIGFNFGRRKSTKTSSS